MYIILNKIDTESLHESLIWPTTIEKVVFLQDINNRNSLGALLVARNLAVLLRPGCMSLTTGQPGRKALEEFCGWLERHWIEKWELRFLTPAAYAKIEFLNYITENDFAKEGLAEQSRLFSELLEGHPMAGGAPLTITGRAVGS